MQRGVVEQHDAPRLHLGGHPLINGIGIVSIFISTDAGGEGLNLQFANIIINYDLPWNPMKIEQRCGRADRICQQRDVHIYNMIVRDTVESRVREVLEEKLSVIMKELGVDKYAGRTPLHGTCLWW